MVFADFQPKNDADVGFMLAGAALSGGQCRQGDGQEGGHDDAPEGERGGHGVKPGAGTREATAGRARTAVRSA